MTSGRYKPPAFLVASAAVHTLALGFIGLRPSVWPYAIATLLANHLSLVAGGLLPRCRILGPNITRLDKLEEGTRAVALTFDDGPDPRLTPQVLGLLEKHGARASFFCVGQRIEPNAALIRDVVQRGHHVENHTWSHPHSFAFLSPAALEREIGRAQSVIAKVAGRTPKYFRAPAGIRSPWLEPVLRRNQLTLTSWTRRGFDTREKDPQRVYRRLVRNLAVGDILLLHDGGQNSALDQKRVVLDVLSRILADIERRGLEAVPLP